MYLSIFQEGDYYPDILGFDTTRTTYGQIVNVHIIPYGEGCRHRSNYNNNELNIIYYILCFISICILFLYRCHEMYLKLFILKEYQFLFMRSLPGVDIIWLSPILIMSISFLWSLQFRQT